MQLINYFKDSSIIYFAAFFLIGFSLYAMVTEKNVVKILIALSLFDYGVNILLIRIGYIVGKTAPIFSKSSLTSSSMVDPIPQALILTAIVIGASELALAAGFVVLLYRKYKTLDITKIRSLKW